MKLRLTKAQDAIISLQNVPFDASRFDVVVSALKSLGSSIEEVAKVVQLTRRTNTALYFRFTGSDVVLKSFFEKYYNHKTWEEIKKEYTSVEGIKEKEESKPISFLEAVKEYFKAKYLINPKNVQYNPAQKRIFVKTLSDAKADQIQNDRLNSQDHTRSLSTIRELDESKLTITEFMWKYKFEIEDMASREVTNSNKKKFYVTSFELTKVRK